MDILQIARKGEQKTNIMYKARLSHAQLESYLDALKKEGFIKEESNLWKTTEKGLSVLGACRICHKMVEEIP
jgi:predicted transcriptional regulator